MRKIILILIGAFLVWTAVAWKAPETFAASDWGNTFWGPQVWNGWNYGSAPKRVAPRPEDTN